MCDCERVLSKEDFKIWNRYKNQFKELYNKEVKRINFIDLVNEKRGQIDSLLKCNKWSTNIDNWKCEKSPVGRCIYEINSWEKFGDECCSFCGEPEERK